MIAHFRCGVFVFISDEQIRVKIILKTVRVAICLLHFKRFCVIMLLSNKGPNCTVTFKKKKM